MRDIVPEDAEDMFELDSDPEVHKYLGNKPITTMDEAEASVEYIRKQYKDNGIGRWAVVEKSSGEFLGWSGLKWETEIEPYSPYYDIGYRFKRKHWGKAYGTETARLSLEYGFNKMGMKEISGGAHVDNVGSNKILSKVGLKYIEQFYYDGMLHNWYTLKRDQYKVLSIK